MKEEDGTETGKNSRTKQWIWEGGSTVEEKKKKKWKGLSVKLAIHHYADPACSTELQKV